MMIERRWVGARVAVWLTGVVAVLSVATGVANVGTSLSGPAAALVPAAVRQTAGFTGALTGFLLLVSALELRRGLRPAWYTTVLLLPIAAFQGFLQSSSLSVPLVVCSLVALPIVVHERSRFERPVAISTAQIAAIVALLGAQAYGTVGAYALREDFSGVSTLVDAFYFALVTASTVGYGDATASTQTARLFALSVVVVGATSFALGLGSLLGPAIEARLETALGHMTDRTLAALDDHVLLLGHGDLTEPILDELGDAPYVLVAPEETLPTALADREVEHLVADPSDEHALERAGIDRARAVVAASPDDGTDALSVLTARQLNPEVRIVAAASSRENLPKLRRAGADAVISPATIGGHLLVRSAFGDADANGLATRLVDGNEDAHQEASRASDATDSESDDDRTD